MESEFSPWKHKNGGGGGDGGGGRRMVSVVMQARHPGGGGDEPATVITNTASPPPYTPFHALPSVLEGVEEEVPQPDTIMRLGDTWPS